MDGRIKRDSLPPLAFTVMLQVLGEGTTKKPSTGIKF
jgi:hypothetical protein